MKQLPYIGKNSSPFPEARCFSVFQSTALTFKLFVLCAHTCVCVAVCLESVLSFGSQVTRLGSLCLLSRLTGCIEFLCFVLGIIYTSVVQPQGPGRSISCLQDFSPFLPTMFPVNAVGQNSYHHTNR